MQVQNVIPRLLKSHKSHLQIQVQQLYGSMSYAWVIKTSFNLWMESSLTTSTWMQLHLSLPNNSPPCPNHRTLCLYKILTESSQQKRNRFSFIITLLIGHYRTLMKMLCICMTLCYQRTYTLFLRSNWLHFMEGEKSSFHKCKFREELMTVVALP